MEKITFEMATELGLIPRPAQRINVSLPFESAYGYERRINSQELGYRAELKRIEDNHKTVEFRGEIYEVI